MMKTKKIDSSSNLLYKKLTTLVKSKGIEENQQCLISGEKVIREYLQSGTQNAGWIFYSEEHPLFEAAPDLQLLQFPKSLYRELDVVGTDAPLLCVVAPKIPKWDPNAALQNNEVLCALGDPNNLGALLRSAKAFGLENIVLLEECAHPFLPKTIKASSGACFGLNFFSGPSIKNLEGVQNILALDMHGQKLGASPLNEKYRILLGEEGQGIPDNISAKKVSIPIHRDVESLNATVAASILFYEIAKP